MLLHTVTQVMNRNTIKPSQHLPVGHLGQQPTRLTITIFVEGKIMHQFFHSCSYNLFVFVIGGSGLNLHGDVITIVQSININLRGRQ